jgi:hypothetical protein
MATDAPQFRTLSWLEMVLKAWGPEYSKPDIAYEFSNGEKKESTDYNGSTLYVATDD